MKNFKIKYFFILFLFLSKSIYAEVPAKITIVGNKNIDDE